ncbi:hypothetical protein ES703_46619 [subsurface metagenome]
MTDINFVYSLRAAIEASTSIVLPIIKSEQVRISFIFKRALASTRLEIQSTNQNDKRLLLKDSIRGRCGFFTTA